MVNSSYRKTKQNNGGSSRLEVGRGSLPLQAGVGLFGDPKAGLSGNVRLRHARSGGWRLLSAKFAISAAVAHPLFA